MNFEKVIFAFFIVLALTLNFGFFIGDPTDPEQHHIYELFAAIVVLFMVIGWIDWAWLWYVIPGEIIVWVAHKDNIERLLAGEERKFQPGDRNPTPPPGSEPEPSNQSPEP